MSIIEGIPVVLKGSPFVFGLFAVVFAIGTRSIPAPQLQLIFAGDTVSSSGGTIGLITDADMRCVTAKPVGPNANFIGQLSVDGQAVKIIPAQGAQGTTTVEVDASHFDQFAGLGSFDLSGGCAPKKTAKQVEVTVDTKAPSCTVTGAEYSEEMRGFSTTVSCDEPATITVQGPDGKPEQIATQDGVAQVPMPDPLKSQQVLVQDGQGNSETMQVQIPKAQPFPPKIMLLQKEMRQLKGRLSFTIQCTDPRFNAGCSFDGVNGLHVQEDSPGSNTYTLSLPATLGVQPEQIVEACTRLQDCTRFTVPHGVYDPFKEVLSKLRVLGTREENGRQIIQIQVLQGLDKTESLTTVKGEGKQEVPYKKVMAIQGLASIIQKYVSCELDGSDLRVLNCTTPNEKGNVTVDVLISDVNGNTVTRHIDIPFGDYSDENQNVVNGALLLVAVTLIASMFASRHLYFSGKEKHLQLRRANSLLNYGKTGAVLNKKDMVTITDKMKKITRKDLRAKVAESLFPLLYKLYDAPTEDFIDMMVQSISQITDRQRREKYRLQLEELLPVLKGLNLIEEHDYEHATARMNEILALSFKTGKTEETRSYVLQRYYASLEEKIAQLLDQSGKEVHIFASEGEMAEDTNFKQTVASLLELPDTAHLWKRLEDIRVRSKRKQTLETYPDLTKETLTKLYIAYALAEKRQRTHDVNAQLDDHEWTGVNVFIYRCTGTFMSPAVRQNLTVTFSAKPDTKK